ncbi:hypothetical protein Tco_0700461 [Tanacetum coccineum]
MDLAVVTFSDDVPCVLVHHRLVVPDLIAFATTGLGLECMLTPRITAYCLALILMVRAFFASAGSVSSVRYSNNGVIHEYHSSSTTARISPSLIDFSFKTSTKTCLVKWAKLVDAILLSASAFLFSLLDFARPFVLLSVNSTPSGFVRMSPALDPFRHEDPSVKRIHGFGISSSVGVSVDGSSSSGSSEIKSAKIWPRMDVRASLKRVPRLDRTDRVFGCTENALSASAVNWKSLFFMQFFRVLKKGRDFSSDFDKNMLKLASFPLRLCTSFSVLGECSFMTAYAFFGHAFIPFVEN